jgi:hypothetical protein
MIPEPQRTYVLELLAALGPTAEDLVLAGAQAMKFALDKARATKDVDFVLDVIALRAEPLRLAEVLARLGYTPVEGARNFQFEKDIPNSREKMRIEFMAPEEYKRRADFRVDVQEGVHARACTGGTIALAESDTQTLTGHLPNGDAFTGNVRVTRPHALVMLKLLALFDRYNNIRGPEEAHHDREEARTHAADIVAIVSAQRDLAEFRNKFEGQFKTDPELADRVGGIFRDFFRATSFPGFLVYEEFLAAELPVGRETQREIREEVNRAHRMLSTILEDAKS